MIKDEFALYIEMLPLDVTKLKWIWTKPYKKEFILLIKCLIWLIKDEILFNKPTVQIFGTKFNLTVRQMKHNEKSFKTIWETLYYVFALPVLVSHWFIFQTST